MPRFGLTAGGFGRQLSKRTDGQLLINMYPEMVDTKQGRSGAEAYLVGAQGTKAFWTLTSALCRAMRTMEATPPDNDRLFTVMGDRFFELRPDGTSINVGNVGFDPYPAYIVGGGSTGGKAVINSATGIYVYDTELFTLTGPLSDTEGGLLQATSVVFANGRWYLSIKNSQELLYSEVFDPLTWDPLNAVSAELNPGRVLRLAKIHNEVWSMGDDVIQPFMNVNDPDNPLQPIQSGIIQIGIYSPASATVLDDRLYWIGKDADRGGPTPFRNMGYTAQRIGNNAIMTEWAKYPREAVATAVGTGFIDRGHAVWQVTFPDYRVRRTWRYDATLPPELQWYQVGLWNSAIGDYTEFHGVHHAYAFGNHYFGGNNFSVYRFDQSYSDYDGTPRRCLRRSPNISAEAVTLFFENLELIVETGLGLDGNPAAQGADPQVMVRWSDDGGHNWDNEVWLPLGKEGMYRWRLVLRSLGRSRDRVFEIIFTDPVPFMLIDGFVDYTPGKKP